MNRPVLLAVPLGLLLLAVAGALWWADRPFNGDPHALASQPPALATASHAAAEPTPTPTARSPRAKGESAQVLPGSPSARLSAELFAATDWRAFAIAALSRPGEGGAFYARYVTNVCGMEIAGRPEFARQAVADEVQRSGTVTPARQTMIEGFMSRCAAFTPGEASEMLRRAKQLAAEGRDPVANAVQKLSDSLKAGGRDAIRAALAEVLALDEPLALFSDQLFRRVLYSGMDPGRAPAPWFDGQQYGAEDAVSVMEIAVQIAACGESAVCELDNLMFVACLGERPCVSDRLEYLRQTYVVEAGLSAARFAEAQALAQRIREAFAQRRVEAFVR